MVECSVEDIPIIYVHECMLYIQIYVPPLLTFAYVQNVYT